MCRGDRVGLNGLTMMTTRREYGDGRRAGDFPRRLGARAATLGAAEPGEYRPGYEVVAEQILQFIAEHELSPGDRMPTEKELAAQLGASRTVVREAVKILSATGRVSAQKGRGLYVADGEGVLGRGRLRRVLHPDQPGPHLHAVRVPPDPGDRGQPAGRDPGQPGRTAGDRGRRAGVPARLTRPATRRSSRPATTPSTSASPPPRTTSSSSPRCARPAGCSGRRA